MAEPVTIDEAKAQVRMVDDDSEDTFLTSLIAPARALVEKRTGLSFVAGERTYSFSRWGDYLEVYIRPVTAVEVTYGEDDTTYTGIAPLGRFPFRVYPASGDTFPTLVDGETITATVTTGALATTSNEYLIGKRAILLLIGLWFENRGEGPLTEDQQRTLDWALEPLSPLPAY